MNNEEKIELNKLMLEHFNEAGYIAGNFINLKADIGIGVRNDVMQLLKDRLGEDFTIHTGEKISNENAQVWIKYKKHPASKLYYGIESFSYNGGEGLDVGILNEEKNNTQYKHDTKTQSGETLWPYYITINPIEGYNFDFDDNTTLLKLYTDKEFKTKFITHIVNEAQEFISIHKEQLLAFLDKQPTNV